MSITTDLNNPVNWLIATLLLALLGGQSWLLWRNRTLSPARKGIRLGLNGLLWLLLVAYFLQPHWPTNRPVTHALFIGEGVPADVARHVQDSLRIPDRFTALPKDPIRYDSVTLLGQRFPTELLPRLSNTAVQWIRYDEPDLLSAIRWQGIVWEGEIQQITGRIQSTKKQVMRLTYGSKTLDSANLTVGNQAFRFQFPVFSRGRTQTELMLGQKTGAGTPLDTVRFFSQAIKPLRVQFLLNNPDFESKNLADWFGKHGHSVQLTTTLSRNISSSTTINKPTKSTNQPHDLLITEPANAAAAPVRKALADGRAVLFIGLTDGEADCRSINQAMGTRFVAHKISNEPAVPISAVLTALPYRFAEAVTQFTVGGYPIAVQRTVSRGEQSVGRTPDGSAGWVGVSLLNETFPLALSGDSLTYTQIWTAVLARMYPTQNAISVDAPVVSQFPLGFSINNRNTALPTRLLFGADTVRLTRSALNTHTATGWHLAGDAGWQAVNDSLAVFVEAARRGNPIVENQTVSRFMAAHALYQPALASKNRQTDWQPSGWLWLSLFLICLTMLWVEPKL